MILENLETVYAMLDIPDKTVPKIQSVKSAKENKLKEPVNASGVGRDLSVLKLHVMLTIVTEMEPV
jgi:hypothetical protein